MGYNTDFDGCFKLDRTLDLGTRKLLEGLNRTRRMKRLVDIKYGVEGEFYVQDDHEGVVNPNEPPSTQPGLWCQWAPFEYEEDGVLTAGLEWDGGEKFYDYVEWLQYLLDKVLIPKGYELSGEVRYRGEDPNDIGVISVEDNKITMKQWQ